jgi:signal transduction histidine kinase
VLATTIAVWFAAATPWVDWNDETTLAVAMAAVAFVGLVEWLRTRHRLIISASWGLPALFLLLLWALIVPQLATILEPIAFDAGVALVGAWLFAGLRARPNLFERSIELDESTGTLRDALAELLRDPSLQVGYTTEQAGLIDELGRPIEADVPGRGTTALAQGAGAVVVHDPGVLTSPEDRQAVTAAVALATTRARLRQELRRRADEISSSTARLIHAEDDERLRLAARLDAGTTHILLDVGRLIAGGRAGALGVPELEASLDRIGEQLDRVTRELETLAAGLGVPALAHGLRSALSELLAGLPLDAELHVADVDLPDELAGTIWFVCAEAVANVLKHANASRVLVEIAETPSGLRVVVEDNGRGGADTTGTGLGGLRDRVVALGGRLDVESHWDGGTRLFAALPYPCAAR